jgi:hypothetical protein
MPDENLERWQELCLLAADEENPAKLVKLVGEINLLLAKTLDYLAFKAVEKAET